MHTDVTVHDLTHEALHEFLHLDGKIFQTLKLLIVKPGELTVEYFRGRRARYISPVRLYLTCSVLFFALAAVAPHGNEKFDVNQEADVPPELRETVARVVDTVVERMHELEREWPHQAPRAMFGLMPFFAFVTWAFYRRTHPYYVPHLYYSIHFHAFLFALLAVEKVLAFAGAAGAAVGVVLLLAIVPYHYIGLKRVFGGTRLQTAWKGTAVGLIYALTIAIIFIAILAAIIGVPFWRLHLGVS